MNELAFGLFGRLQADRYVRVSVVDLRRLRCDRVVMKLLFRGSLVLWFRHRHSLHEVMQVQLRTLDMRNLLAVLGICSWICTKKSLIVAQQISYNAIPPGEDMLYYVHVHTEEYWHIGCSEFRYQEADPTMHLLIDWRPSANKKVGYQQRPLDH